MVLFPSLELLKISYPTIPGISTPSLSFGYLILLNWTPSNLIDWPPTCWVLGGFVKWFVIVEPWVIFSGNLWCLIGKPQRSYKGFVVPVQHWELLFQTSGLLFGGSTPASPAPSYATTATLEWTGPGVAQTKTVTVT